LVVGLYFEFARKRTTSSSPDTELKDYWSGCCMQPLFNFKYCWLFYYYLNQQFKFKYDCCIFQLSWNSCWQESFQPVLPFTVCS
jgi:hypothetical protein